MASSINASTTAGVVTTADTSGVLNIQTAGTTAIAIDASQAVSFTNSPTVTGGTANGVAYLNGSKVLTTGSALVFDGTNLGVGTTTPDIFSRGYGRIVGINDSGSSGAALEINSASSYPAIELGRGGVRKAFFTAQSTATEFGNLEAVPLIFYTNSAERARIDSSGNVRINYTGNIDASNPERFGITYTYPQTGMAMANGSTSTTYAILFTNPNGIVGSITTSTSATSYVTSSDYRLKNTIAPMVGALGKVAQLRPVTYKWNSDGSDGQGFIAHELQEVAPYAVSGEKDGKDMQGVDYGRITPLLTAALQEAIAKIELLEARLALLESK